MEFMDRMNLSTLRSCSASQIQHFSMQAQRQKCKILSTPCKDKLGVIVESKTVFLNSMSYLKKNRYVAWTGIEKEEPIINGLDGLSDSNPL
jgi:hypothetical protein